MKITALWLAVLSAPSFAQEVREPLQLRGEVLPPALTEVKPEASGSIKKIHVRIGDQVKVGDLLFEIDELASDEGYARHLSNLAPRPLNSMPVTETIPDPFVWTKVHAPKSGTVVYMPVMVDQFVAPATEEHRGTPIITIADHTKREVFMNVPERDFTRVKKNQVVRVTVPSASGEELEAVVSSIAFSPSMKTDGIKGFGVVARINAPPEDLRPGTVVQVVIPPPDAN